MQKANVDSKERRRIESREEQARRELEHVRREKEKLVDKNSELAIALKQANDEIKIARDECERLKDKINIYEMTFPMTISRKNKFVVPTLNLNSEQDKNTDNSTLNTCKQRNDNF